LLFTNKKKASVKERANSALAMLRKSTVMWALEKKEGADEEGQEQAKGVMA
jgi:hypothetical protein